MTLKMKELLKIVKPGVMVSGLQYNSIKNSTEVVFIIKDYDYKVKKMADKTIADTRASLEFNNKAVGIIHLVRFGYESKNIYHHWYDKTLQGRELIQLLHQNKIPYFLVNEKNEIVEILVIENSLKEIIYKYLISNDPIWSIRDFDQLVLKTMGKYKSRSKIWDYITKNMAS